MLRQLTDDQRIEVATDELRQAFSQLQNVSRGVTVFGSARCKENSDEYKVTRELAYKLAKEAEATIITGGGPGLMEAGNRGAADAGSDNVGLLIELPHEQGTNPYVTLPVNFRYFFTRKVAFVRYSTAFVAMPGGIGTLDELTEVLCLVQTGKVKRYPIVLYGTDFWGGFVDWIEGTLVAKGMISPEDMELFTVTDDLDQIVAICNNACNQYSGKN